jgi:hypothetical protein
VAGAQTHLRPLKRNLRRQFYQKETNQKIGIGVIAARPENSALVASFGTA